MHENKTYRWLERNQFEAYENIKEKYETKGKKGDRSLSFSLSLSLSLSIYLSFPLSVSLSVSLFIYIYIYEGGLKSS